MVPPTDGDRMANGADPNQTVLEPSDLGLHCLQISINYTVQYFLWRTDKNCISINIEYTCISTLFVLLSELYIFIKPLFQFV